MASGQQPLNALIWISVKPVLKLAGPTVCGFWLTKSDLLPPAGSRSVSQIILVSLLLCRKINILAHVVELHVESIGMPK